MKFSLYLFFRQNFVGSITGAALCGLGIALFFLTLGYGASCPEAGPEKCSIDLKPLIPILSANVILFMGIWMILFYLAQQIMLLVGIVTSETYSESFFATSIVPVIIAGLTLFIWGLIGGMIQKIVRGIRK